MVQIHSPRPILPSTDKWFLGFRLVYSAADGFAPDWAQQLRYGGCHEAISTVAF